MPTVQAEQKCALLKRTQCSFLVLLIHLGLVCFKQILTCSNQLSRKVEPLFLPATDVIAIAFLTKWEIKGQKKSSGLFTQVNKVNSNVFSWSFNFESPLENQVLKDFYEKC